MSLVRRAPLNIGPSGQLGFNSAEIGRNVPELRFYMASPMPSVTTEIPVGGNVRFWTEKYDLVNASTLVHYRITRQSDTGNERWRKQLNLGLQVFREFSVDNT